MSVAIVDYGSGNLHSAAKAFERAARESGHDQPIVVTNEPENVHFSYQRYVQNQIRKAFGFEGTPIRVRYRPEPECSSSAAQA